MGGVWENKQERAMNAMLHTDDVEKRFAKYINDSVEHTTMYGIDYVFKNTPNQKNGIIKIDDLDSVSALYKYHGNGKCALLNFSSYKNPGGMFMNGSGAQEECLCHESTLYSVLKRIPSFYDWNNQHKNKSLYLNRGLYSPNIVFERNSKSLFCDVITCAAPNKYAAQKYAHVSNEENTKYLASRIEFILNMAKEQNVDILILGAYGCGVFGQDASEVASIFKTYLNNEFKNAFNICVFAIPNGRNENYRKFVKVLA